MTLYGSAPRNRGSIFGGLLVFGLAAAAVFAAWDRAVTRDGLVRFFDDHPGAWKAEKVLIALAGFHETFNNNRRALEIYERIRKRYPKSPQAESAQYGVAHMHELLGNRAQAVLECELYLEKYPQGRYARSVRRNIDLLRQ